MAGKGGSQDSAASSMSARRSVAPIPITATAVCCQLLMPPHCCTSAVAAVCRCHCCHRRQVSIGPDVSAIEAMVLMNEQQISAVAVVDGVGKIIGNFSVSEMRCEGRGRGGG